MAWLPPAYSFPFLPRLGLGVVSRASVPQGSITTPTRAVSTPITPNVSLSFAPFGQFPMAHRPLASCWLAGGSRAICTPACESGPFPRRPPPNRLIEPARPTSTSSRERAPSLGLPSESRRTRVNAPACPASPASGRLHHRRACAPDERTPPRLRVRPRLRLPSPTQARASATGASSTGPQIEIAYIHIHMYTDTY